MGSFYINDMAYTISDMANRYYNQCNYEVPFFHTQYIRNYVYLYIFNRHPSAPIDNTQMDWNRLLMIKLKNMFHEGRVVKSKQLIQDQLGYQINLNDYIHLRSAAIQCPTLNILNKNPHKSFDYFVKSLKNSKQLRVMINCLLLRNVTLWVITQENLTYPNRL